MAKNLLPLDCDLNKNIFVSAMSDYLKQNEKPL